jgi:hypothetical protein
MAPLEEKGNIKAIFFAVLDVYWVRFPTKKECMVMKSIEKEHLPSGGYAIRVRLRLLVEASQL